VNRDGTYDIRYSDGDSESGVSAKLIRRPAGARSGATAASAAAAGAESKPLDSDTDSICFDVGDEIEARFGGRARWFRGTVMKRNRDGSYHIRYADGDEEKAVDAALIRRVAGAAAASGSSSSKPKDSGRAAAAAVYREGDKIEARYKGRERWFAGVIRRANRDDTYDLNYDDGERELGVAADLIRLAGSASSSSKAATVLREGDKIEARYKGRERWFAGVIRRVNRDDTYDINYDDGERELGVAANLVRLVGGTSSSSKPDKAAVLQYREGDKIEARYKGRDRYFPGVVRRVNRDDTYDINYDDGERELGVAANLVRLIGSSSSSSSKPDKAAAVVFREGDKIEARYKGRERWFAGVIRRVNRDDTYDINYDDGERELGVAADLIRLAGSSSNKTTAPLQLREGDKIEARYKGRERWFAGVIRRVNRDDTYDINYDDGERELGVASELVRLIGSTSSSKKATDSSVDLQLREGDKIEARYRGRERWFAGTVKRANRDGTYDINYDDGERELSVATELVRLIGSTSSSSRAAAAAVVFREGDKIEARYKGRERYFPGVVRRVNRDDTYDINYDDGERELGVAANLIRLTGSSSSKAVALVYREGDKIEARYKGRERWFAGVIRRANRDDTYDINYDDGERELGVAAELIRLTSSSSSSASKLDKASLQLRDGDKIEARYRGRERYFAGVVRRCNRDGSYDIDYDDGAKELSVAAELIRLVGSSSSNSRMSAVDSDVESPSKASYSIGDNIEADFKGMLYTLLYYTVLLVLARATAA
jgi:Agenet domain